MILLQADSALFFGRFHPLIVHLPIGFLLLAAVLFAFSFFKKYAFLLSALPIIIFFGAISAVAAAMLGWLLATEGGYQESTLAWHQWMGISVAVVAIAAWVWISGLPQRYFQRNGEEARVSPEEVTARTLSHKKEVGIVMLLLFVLITITGHLGGNLTHGEQYLFTYAPEVVQTLFIDDPGNAQEQSQFPVDPDSILLYTHLIEPALEKKCTPCHNENKKKGGLLLTSREGLLKGGENGAVVEKGSPQNSELFKRVCLDPSSKKFMPPKGSPMSYTEIALLNYWITSGMSFELTITDESIPEEIKNLIEQGYSLSTKKKSFLEKEEVPAVNAKVLDSLQKQGYRIKTLAAGNNFLDVVATDSLTLDKFKALLSIKEQITWLDLGNTGFQDNWLNILNQFPNLTRLALDNNEISDKGIAQLESFEHLEAINLYATSVGDAGLKLLSKQKKLRKIYVWQTKVTTQTVDSIRKENQLVSIDHGVAQSDTSKVNK
jgi:uncharacterized membrane protein